MKLNSKITVLALGFLLGGGSIAAQNKSANAWLVELGGAALASATQPTGLGGTIAGGYSTRDFNILLRAEALVAEPGVNQRMLLMPGLMFEWKFVLVPSWLTLLPYVHGGVIGAKVRKSAGYMSDTEYTYFAEIGLGAEFQLTHEVSLVPRMGVASALLYSGNDSNNYSGLSVSCAVRYTFNRSPALDY